MCAFQVFFILTVALLVKCDLNETQDQNGTRMEELKLEYDLPSIVEYILLIVIFVFVMTFLIVIFILEPCYDKYKRCQPCSKEESRDVTPAMFNKMEKKQKDTQSTTETWFTKIRPSKNTTKFPTFEWESRFENGKIVEDSVTDDDCSDSVHVFNSKNHSGVIFDLTDYMDCDYETDMTEEYEINTEYVMNGTKKSRDQNM